MKTILFVEDDKRISLALGTRLKSLGYDVIPAYDAATAPMLARKHRPDIALLDITMPGGDGFMVAERLRKLTPELDIPMIFITASEKDGLRERAMEIGAAGFLEKPFAADQLVQLIEDALQIEVIEAPAEQPGSPREPAWLS